jgi:ERCC4-type nuclease
MLIKIDFREIKLITLMTELLKTEENVKIQSENLPLGDIILCDDEGQEKAIIERKSLADLAASIRDGRYKEQSFRLNECALHNHQIYYLIEGDLRYYRPFKGLPDKKALLSAMTSISYFKGFSLTRTLNLEETAEWVLHFAHKLEKEGTQALPFYTSDKTATNTTYAEVINKRIKKDNITPENIGEIMLAQIPQVSSASAAAIMKKYGTFSDLMNALQTDSNTLKDVTTTNKNGQHKNLTKPCINAIYAFLVKQTIINVDL